MGSWERIATPQQRLREAMDLTSKTQIDLSRETGIPKSTISRYLSGGYEPKSTALYKLGKALGCSEMWLAGYDTQQERPQTQKDNDELADLIERLKEDIEFRKLVLIIDHMEPEQLKLISDLANAIKVSK